MIEVSHLSKSYGSRPAVQDLSFTVPDGQIYGLLGPNGAGKSTIMNILTGYLAPTEGEVKVAGFRLPEQAQQAKACVGYLPERPPLYPGMTVQEYLDFVAELKGVKHAQRKQQVLAAARRTGLEEVLPRVIRSLSKGHRQRVGIAQALLGKYLVRNRNGELLAGRITETEAYVGRCDKACHAYNYRRTPRTETLFMAPGHAYIYFIYGMYHCLNFVTEPEGEPSAVLLRGLEPAAGAETMKRLRFGNAPMNAYRRKNFLNGPGKVCKALDLTTAQNKLDLEGDVLFLCDSMADVGLTDPVTGPEHICAGPRIGVDYAEEAKDFPWRFWLEKEN